VCVVIVVAAASGPSWSWRRRIRVPDAGEPVEDAEGEAILLMELSVSLPQGVTTLTCGDPLRPGLAFPFRW
jgi:hypothetical protein